MATAKRWTRISSASGSSEATRTVAPVARASLAMASSGESRIHTSDRGPARLIGPCRYSMAGYASEDGRAAAACDRHDPVIAPVPRELRRGEGVGPTTSGRFAKDSVRPGHVQGSAAADRGDPLPLSWKAGLHRGGQLDSPSPAGGLRCDLARDCAHLGGT